VTSLAEGGTMCWISFGAHGAAGSGRVGWLIGERGGQARSRGDEWEREIEHEVEKMEEASPLRTRGRIRTALSTRAAASTGEAGSAAHSAEGTVTCRRDLVMVWGSQKWKLAADRWAWPN
jgi:hypothetical protein